MTRGRTFGWRTSIAARDAELITEIELEHVSTIVEISKTWLLTGTVEIVSIVLGIPITCMDNISSNGLVTERASSIVNLIRRRNEIAIRQPKLATSLAALFAVLLRLEVIGKARNSARRLASRRRRGRQIVIFGVLLGVAAWPGTKIGGFVHVNPETVDVDTVVLIKELLELIVPPLLCGVRVEPVRVDGYAGPDGT